jgi:chemotaxis signal transduction protein
MTNVDHIQSLKSSFDEIFAQPYSEAHEQTEDFLAIRIAGDPFAIRLNEVSGLMNNKKVVPLPSNAPGILGVAGIRNEPVPVYSLAALLGYSQEKGLATWLILHGTRELIALACSDFEGHLRIPSPQAQPVAPEDTRPQHLRNIVKSNGQAYAVISLPTLVEAIPGKFSRDHSPKD